MSRIDYWCHHHPVRVCFIFIAVCLVPAWFMGG